MIISLLFLMLFGILGTNFYKGRFFYCYDNNIDYYTRTKIFTKWECLDYGGEWINRDNNFDNVANSMVTLFNLISSEGWTDVMWTGTDSVDIDMNSIYSYQTSIYISQKSNQAL